MTDKRIINILIVICVLFMSLIGYLTYLELFKAEELAKSPYNQRQWAYEEDIERGMILDKEGVILAQSKDGERKYPYDNMYSHIIGYNSRIYGKSLLESKYNQLLLGQYGLGGLNITGNKKNGYNLYLTIDHNLQKVAYNSIGNRNGSAVAINPKTGEILAMVSKPDFNPNALSEQWESLVDNENSPLLPRATSGLYAPGSTFKILTASAALDLGLQDTVFEDKGSIEIGGKTVSNSGGKAYGNITFDRAFEVSSNVAFCSLGVTAGFDRLKLTAEKFGFNKEPDYDFPVAKSIFPSSAKEDAETAALAMGQGNTLATPLQMALVACAVANDGIIMEPRLVSHATNNSGVTILSTKPKQQSVAMPKQNADYITDMMVKTVSQGTGTSAIINGITVAGKTGTAENEQTVMQKNKEHTWFVAFAPAEDPEIAVAVMLEYSGGSGASVCGPIVRNIIREYLR